MEHNPPCFNMYDFNLFYLPSLPTIPTPSHLPITPKKNVVLLISRAPPPLETTSLSDILFWETTHKLGMFIFGASMGLPFKCASREGKFIFQKRAQFQN